MGDKVEESPEQVRIDQWLWAVRIYRTRSLAASACRKGQVQVLGKNVKPSRSVRVGDEIAVERTYLKARFRVRELLRSRIGAKLVPAYREDLTTEEEWEEARALAAQNRAQGIRSEGRGRPTKKDRRKLEALAGLDAFPLEDEEVAELWKKAIR